VLQVTRNNACSSNLPVELDVLGINLIY